MLRLDKTVGDDPAEKHLLSEWWDAVIKRRPIRCIQDQQFSRRSSMTWLRVSPACRKGSGGVLNLTNSECFLRSELAEQFVAESGAVSEVVQMSQTDLAWPTCVRRVAARLERFCAGHRSRFTPMHQVVTSFPDKVRRPVPIRTA